MLQLQNYVQVQEEGLQFVIKTTQIGGHLNTMNLHKTWPLKKGVGR